MARHDSQLARGEFSASWHFEVHKMAFAAFPSAEWCYLPIGT